jgi:hypothetical protein
MWRHIRVDAMWAWEPGGVRSRWGGWTGGGPGSGHRVGRRASDDGMRRAAKVLHGVSPLGTTMVLGAKEIRGATVDDSPLRVGAASSPTAPCVCDAHRYRGFFPAPSLEGGESNWKRTCSRNCRSCCRCLVRLSCWESVVPRRTGWRPLASCRCAGSAAACMS